MFLCPRPDEKQKNHTKYLLSNGYSSINLPTWKSDGFRKTVDRPLPVGFKGFSKTKVNVSSTATQPSNSDSEDINLSNNSVAGLVTNVALNISF